jgi:hypothetical protein
LKPLAFSEYFDAKNPHFEISQYVGLKSLRSECGGGLEQVIEEVSSKLNMFLSHLNNNLSRIISSTGY